MLYGIATAIAALLLAAALSALLRVPALRLGLVDRRRVRPVPLLGGVAVVVSTCLVAAAGGWTGAAPLGDGVGKLLAAGAGVAVLGLVADVWRLKTRFLLVGTAVAAAFVVPYDETGVPMGILSVAWIACVAAAFRGLDHADGLAGTVGVLTAFGAGACAAAEVMDDLAVLLSVLAAALTGFLMHNWHPARITFGACGSLFTGFVLASAAVLTRTGYDPLSTAAVLFALTATASADAVLVVLSRKLAGRPVLRRGPDHLAHRLRRLGLTPPGATVLLGAVTFAAVLVGVLVHSGLLERTGVMWVAGATLVAVLGLLCVPVYGPRRQTGLHGTRGRTAATGVGAATGVHATRGRTGASGTRTRTRAPGPSEPRDRTDRSEARGTRSRTGPHGMRTRTDPYGTRPRTDPYDGLDQGLDQDFDRGLDQSRPYPSRGRARVGDQSARGRPYAAGTREAPGGILGAPGAPGGARRQPEYLAPPPQ